MNKKIDFRTMSDAKPIYILYRFLKIELLTTLKYFFNCLRGRAALYRRNVQVVYSIYEKRRLDHKENYEFTTLDEYAFTGAASEAEMTRWNLFNHKLQFGLHKAINEKLFSLLEEKINSSNINYIVELGSGSGRNILYLAKKFPDKKFIGIELSPVSVELSKLAADQFRITNIEFYVGDLTKVDVYSELIISSSLVFTKHCFEEMPRIFKIPLGLLKKKKVKSIFLLEPAFIFQLKRHLLEVCRILRIIHRDRLFGLPSFCKKEFSKDYHINFVDLGIGTNPLNPTTMVDIELKK